ncbi:hypothetical protein LMG29660_02093 [Burkholderia puraquae]|uniref:Uncharacterized protein n=1 Tax=Burkholderia puraquae TaxID=1904757 RepID=A0A6J5DJ07_9BURK|nr:hypothetical protein [Burkholderia puraquae]CAB3753454.1 hypothetical protein LMG29660_02093 [Burkholderia puraquae]
MRSIVPGRRIDGASWHGIFRADTLARTMRDQRIDIVLKRARE